MHGYLRIQQHRRSGVQHSEGRLHDHRRPHAVQFGRATHVFQEHQIAARMLHLEPHRLAPGQTGDLDDAQAGMLLSLAGNLRISQVVNPAKGCIMEFPIGLAGERFER